MNVLHHHAASLVQVNQLAVTFYTPKGTIHAVRDASFKIDRNEVLCMVGESGCGKSTVALTIIGYLQGIARVEGEIQFEGMNVLSMSASELRKLRGNRMAMVYQDPVTSLNPSMRVGPQVEEALQVNLGLNSYKARVRAAELFDSVGLADPEQIGRRYPHQLSGGMQQRIVIAMALSCDPDLLIMDEPTTGLDVTIEATILDLVVDLKRRVRAGILYVTHNLGVVARVADRVTVMYAGQVVEQAPVRELFKSPQHPYTVGLLTCVPQPPSTSATITSLSGIPGVVYDVTNNNVQGCLFAPRCPMARNLCLEEAPGMVEVGDGHQSRCIFHRDISPELWGKSKQREIVYRKAVPILSARDLCRFYGRRQRKYLLFGPRLQTQIRAVEDVDFDVGSGRTLGIVGESGSGKTTIARVVVGLVRRDRGELLMRGQILAPGVEERSVKQRAGLRMVFQNPTASLNPRLHVYHVIQRSLWKFAGLGRKEGLEAATKLMKAVGLNPAYLQRLPGELSGGEKQRVALASAFSGNADLIVADEAVSSLDVSVQAQILELLRKYQKEEGVSYVFISHDLGVVRYVSDEILVLYAGHVAESGPAMCVLDPPWHPYTEALLSAVPIPDPDVAPARMRLYGSLPTLRERFKGCFFVGRCPRKIGSICEERHPPARIGPDSTLHTIYCHITLDELMAKQCKREVT